MQIIERTEITLQPALFADFVSYIDRGPQTTRTYLTNLRQFAAWTYYAGISRPTRQDLLSYREYLLSEHDAIELEGRSWKYRLDSTGNRYRISCKPSTAAQYLRSVCQFFRWTAAAGIYPNIAENIHAPKVSADRHKKEALAPADVQAIEESIQDQIDRAGEPLKEEQARRLQAMFLLAVTAGLRTVEISRANIKDLVTRNGKASLYVWGKGRTEPDTKKPLAREVYAAIRDYLESRTDKKTGSSPLFVATGNRSGGKRLATTTISTLLKKALQQAGYISDRITPHSLRHTAGTSVQELTGDLYLTQKYMRHQNPATTEIYLHNDTERQEEDIAQRLFAFYHSKQTTRTKEETTMKEIRNPEIIKLALLLEERPDLAGLINHVSSLPQERQKIVIPELISYFSAAPAR